MSNRGRRRPSQGAPSGADLIATGGGERRTRAGSRPASPRRVGDDADHGNASAAGPSAVSVPAFSAPRGLRSSTGSALGAGAGRDLKPLLRRSSGEVAVAKSGANEASLQAHFKSHAEPSSSREQVKTGPDEMDVEGSNAGGGGSGSAQMEAAPHARRAPSSRDVVIQVCALDERACSRDATEASTAKLQCDEVLCRTIHHMRSSPERVDQYLMTSLALLVKTRPHLFTHKAVLETIVGTLRTSAPENQRIRKASSPLLLVVLANLLFHALRHMPHWPLVLLHAYLEDSLGHRVWVDDARCKALTEEIVSFSWDVGDESGDSKGNVKREGEKAMVPHMKVVNGEEVLSTAGTVCRYRTVESRRSAHNLVVDTLTFHVKRISQSTNTLSLIKTFSRFVSIQRVRHISGPLLQDWFNSPTFMRKAKQYLLKVVDLSNDTDPGDMELVRYILDLRVKPVFLQVYYECVAALLDNNEEYPLHALSLLLHGEVCSSSDEGSGNGTRNRLIQIAFGKMKGDREEEVALLLQEMAADDDLWVGMRGLVKLLLRQFGPSVKNINDGNAFSIVKLVRTLVEERAEMREQTEQAQLNWIVRLADLVSYVCILHATSLTVTGADPASKAAVRNRIADVQAAAMQWCHATVYKHVRDGPAFLYVTRKLVFAEPLQAYVSGDGQTREGHEVLTEHEQRVVFPLLLHEQPVREMTLMCVLLIALTGTYPVRALDGLELIRLLLSRAAPVGPSVSANPIRVENVQLADAIVKLCVYHPPASLLTEQQLEQYSGKFGVSSWYFDCCVQLLIIAAFNPSTIAPHVWQRFPIMRCFIEVCITDKFPEDVSPPSLDPTSARVKAVLELDQALSDSSLRREGKALRTVTVQTSSLLHPENGLLLFDPSGPAVRPPENIITAIRDVNRAYHVAERLAWQGNTIVDDVMKKYGATSAVNWLLPIISRSPTSIERLPYPPLCALLLACSSRSRAENERIPLDGALARLSGALHSDDPADTTLILEELLSALSNGESGAKSVLESVLLPKKSESRSKKTDSSNPTRWLKGLPRLRHFQAVKSTIFSYLSATIRVEGDPAVLGGYVKLLVTHSDRGSVCATVSEIARRLTVDRPAFVVRKLFANDVLSLECAQACIAALQAASESECNVKDLSAAVDLSLMLITTCKGDSQSLFSVEENSALLTDAIGGLVEAGEVSQDRITLILRSEAGKLQQTLLAKVEVAQLFRLLQELGLSRSGVTSLIHALGKRATKHDAEQVCSTAAMTISRIRHHCSCVGIQAPAQLLTWLHGAAKDNTQTDMDVVEPTADHQEHALADDARVVTESVSIEEVVRAAFEDGGGRARQRVIRGLLQQRSGQDKFCRECLEGLKAKKSNGRTGSALQLKEVLFALTSRVSPEVRSEVFGWWQGVQEDAPSPASPSSAISNIDNVNTLLSAKRRLGDAQEQALWRFVLECSSEGDVEKLLSLLLSVALDPTHPQRELGVEMLSRAPWSATWRTYLSLACSERPPRQLLAPLFHRLDWSGGAAELVRRMDEWGHAQLSEQALLCAAQTAQALIQSNASWRALCGEDPSLQSTAVRPTILRGQRCRIDSCAIARILRWCPARHMPPVQTADALLSVISCSLDMYDEHELRWLLETLSKASPHALSEWFVSRVYMWSPLMARKVMPQLNLSALETCRRYSSPLDETAHMLFTRLLVAFDDVRALQSLVALAVQHKSLMRRHIQSLQAMVVSSTGNEDDLAHRVPVFKSVFALLRVLVNDNESVRPRVHQLQLQRFVRKRLPLAQDGEVLAVINEALRRCEAINFSLEETALLARLIVDVAGKAVCRSSLLVAHAAFVGALADELRRKHASAECHLLSASSFHPACAPPAVVRALDVLNRCIGRGCTECAAPYISSMLWLIGSADSMLRVRSLQVLLHYCALSPNDAGLVVARLKTVLANCSHDAFRSIAPLLSQCYRHAGENAVEFIEQLFRVGAAATPVLVQMME